MKERGREREKEEGRERIENRMGKKERNREEIRKKRSKCKTFFWENCTITNHLFGV